MARVRHDDAGGGPSVCLENLLGRLSRDSPGSLVCDYYNASPFNKTTQDVGQTLDGVFAMHKAPDWDLMGPSAFTFERFAKQLCMIHGVDSSRILGLPDLLRRHG
jgi:hypothetical protein